MPFNPNIPADDSLIEAPQMRSQFSSLKTLIDNVPAGPRGPQGVPGPDGPQGAQGPQGNDGPQGPPFANATVDGVTTLGPGSPATVGVAFDGTTVHFSFGIPQGYEGATGPAGPQGNDGPQGPEGPQGQPGEVSTQQLSNAIAVAVATTSSNSNAVASLGIVVSDPPTQADVQAAVNKLDELILALRRS